MCIILYTIISKLLKNCSAFCKLVGTNKIPDIDCEQLKILCVCEALEEN